MSERLRQTLRLAEVRTVADHQQPAGHRLRDPREDLDRRRVTRFTGRKFET